MSRNNPVGNIPIKTPMLSRIFDATRTVYLNMTEDEVKALDKEIKSVTETNCSADIYMIWQRFWNVELINTVKDTCPLIEDLGGLRREREI